MLYTQNNYFILNLKGNRRVLSDNTRLVEFGILKLLFVLLKYLFNLKMSGFMNLILNEFFGWTQAGS